MRTTDAPRNRGAGPTWFRGWPRTALSIGTTILVVCCAYFTFVGAVSWWVDSKELAVAKRISVDPVRGIATDATVLVPHKQKWRRIGSGTLRAVVTTPYCHCDLVLEAPSHDPKEKAGGWQPAPPPYVGTFDVVVTRDDPIEAMAVLDFTRVISGVEVRRTRAMTMWSAAAGLAVLPIRILVQRSEKRDEERGSAAERTRAGRRTASRSRTRS